MEQAVKNTSGQTGGFWKNYWAILIPVIVLIAALFFLFKNKHTETDNTVTGMVDAPVIDVSSAIPGRIEKLLVKEGDTVSQDQLLMALKSESIDVVKDQAADAVTIAEQNLSLLKRGVAPEVLQSAVNVQRIAEQQLELVGKTYDRMVQLYDRGVISGQEKDLIAFKFEAAKKELETARLNVELLRKGSNEQMLNTAKSLLSQARSAEQLAGNVKEAAEIKAPVAGVITTVVSKQGEMINAGYPVMTIQLLNAFHINFNIRQDQMTKIEKGTVIDLKIPGCIPEIMKGTVTELAPALGYADWVPADQAGQMELRTFSIKVVPENLSAIRGLRSGMIAQLVLP